MMVLYQSLIRNLLCALYNLSISVLLLSASVFVKTCKIPAGAVKTGIRTPSRGSPGEGLVLLRAPCYVEGIWG